MNWRDRNPAALAAVLLLLALSARGAHAASPPALIPAPEKLVMRDGSFELTRPVTIVAETGAEREAGTLAEELRIALDSDPIAVAKPSKPGAIRLEKKGTGLRATAHLTDPTSTPRKKSATSSLLRPNGTSSCSPKSRCRDTSS